MLKIILICTALVAALAGCGGGGCDAGRPGFESAKDTCAERADEPEAAASAPVGR